MVCLLSTVCYKYIILFSEPSRSNPLNNHTHTHTLTLSLSLSLPLSLPLPLPSLSSSSSPPLPHHLGNAARSQAWPSCAEGHHNRSRCRARSGCLPVGAWHMAHGTTHYPSRHDTIRFNMIQNDERAYICMTHHITPHHARCHIRSYMHVCVTVNSLCY